jgi:hypothetical protein
MLMNIKLRIGRGRRPAHKKIAHLSRRLFKLGCRDAGEITIPDGFCGAQADLWWQTQYAERLRTSREIALLTKRLQILVAKQAGETTFQRFTGRDEMASQTQLFATGG